MLDLAHIPIRLELRPSVASCDACCFDNRKCAPLDVLGGRCLDGAPGYYYHVWEVRNAGVDEG